MKNKGLKKPLRIQWRTDDEGYEFIMRSIFHLGGIPESITEAEHKKWFTTGWRERLERLRECHRAAGIGDARFKYPGVKK